MRKLSEYRGEDALDILAELMTPATNIIQDVDVQNYFNSENKKLADVATTIIRKYKKDILHILSTLNEGEEYNPNVFELLSDVIDILSDEVLVSFFDMQAQKIGAEPFGSATENTEGGEK